MTGGPIWEGEIDETTYNDVNTLHVEYLGEGAYCVVEALSALLWRLYPFFEYKNRNPWAMN